MASIYSEASTVHIWLGEDDGPTALALKIIRDIHNFDQRTCRGGEACHCKGTTHTAPLDVIDDMIREQASSSFKAMNEILEFYSSKLSADLVNAVGGLNGRSVIVMPYLMSWLFSKPWFRRVWVVQEALLARFALVHCGLETITWNELLACHDWLKNEDVNFAQAYLPENIVMPSIFTSLRDQATHKERPGILDVFLCGLELQATDPRDKLFGLLSFGHETFDTAQISFELQPSYIKPLARVLTDFTKWWIRKHQSLSILSLVHGERHRAWVRASTRSLQGV